MYPIDRILTGERFRNILRETARGVFNTLEEFIGDFVYYAEEEYSDPFLFKMQTIGRFLVDVGAYEYLDRILELDFTIALYENEGYEGEECILTYAVRKIEDENVLEGFLSHFDTDRIVTNFFTYPNPATVAAPLKKYRTLKLLYDKKLCDEKTCFGRWTLLQYAVVYRDYELAEFSLDVLGHRPDYYYIIEETPMELVDRIYDVRMFRILSSHGADLKWRKVDSPILDEIDESMFKVAGDTE